MFKKTIYKKWETKPKHFYKHTNKYISGYFNLFGISQFPFIHWIEIHRNRISITFCANICHSKLSNSCIYLCIDGVQVRVLVLLLIWSPSIIVPPIAIATSSCQIKNHLRMVYLLYLHRISIHKFIQQEQNAANAAYATRTASTRTIWTCSYGVRFINLPAKDSSFSSSDAIETN